MRQATFHFSLELIAMTAVIAISSWHVGNYMNTFDGWLMATIMGATLGFCNFLMAHNIFKPNTTTRLPSFCGLVFFACTSTYMQYTYFNANGAIGKTLLMGINLDSAEVNGEYDLLLDHSVQKHVGLRSIAFPVRQRTVPTPSDRARYAL